MQQQKLFPPDHATVLRGRVEVYQVLGMKAMRTSACPLAGQSLAKQKKKIPQCTLDGDLHQLTNPTCIGSPKEGCSSWTSLLQPLGSEKAGKEGPSEHPPKQ